MAVKYMKKVKIQLPNIKRYQVLKISLTFIAYNARHSARDGN